MKEKTKPVRLPESLHLRIKTHASSEGKTIQGWLIGVVLLALPQEKKNEMSASTIPFPESRPTLKPAGNRVLLLRLDNNQHEFSMPDGSRRVFELRKTYATGGSDSVVFRVLAVGPGGYEKRPTKRGFKWVWVVPSVKPGELCLSYHWYSQGENIPSPHYLDNADGSGRVIVDSRLILASWNPNEKT
jgi:hypothetical protein